MFYDFLVAICPKCFYKIDAEVKGTCTFEEYDLDKPLCITEAKMLIGNVIECTECHTKFQITGEIPPYKIYLKLEEIT